MRGRGLQFTSTGITEPSTTETHRSGRRSIIDLRAPGYGAVGLNDRAAQDQSLDADLSSTPVSLNAVVCGW